MSKLYTTTLTSVGGPIAPMYVHGRFAIKESEFTSKEGNLSSSISSKLVFPADVEGDVVDNIYCVRKLVGCLVFAAYFNQ